MSPKRENVLTNAHLSSCEFIATKAEGPSQHYETIELLRKWSPQSAKRFYVNRAFGGDRDHCDPGGHVVAGARESKSQDTGHKVHEQFEANAALLAPIRYG